MATTTPRRGRPATGKALSAAERMRRYRARRRDAGLKLASHWREAGPDALTEGALTHRIIEARSLAMHCLAARKISEDPSLLEIPRRNLANWVARYEGDVPRALAEWREILDRPLPEIAALMTSSSERAAQLRQSSPFAGVLTQRERRRVYAAFRP